jgi:hypothetical protein
MSIDRPSLPDRLPTLTEVVQMPEAGAAGQGGVEGSPQAPAGSSGFVERRSPGLERRANWASPQAEPLTERVLADLQRQVDLMLETRMRETLAPALTRATDALVRDMRHELALTLREVVARAVAQELARHRGR